MFIKTVFVSLKLFIVSGLRPEMEKKELVCFNSDRKNYV